MDNVRQTATTPYYNARLGARPIGGLNTLFIVLEADTAADGVDATRAAIGSRAPVSMELENHFYGMRQFGIEDPDGYAIFFAQRIPE